MAADSGIRSQQFGDEASDRLLTPAEEAALLDRLRMLNEKLRARLSAEQATPDAQQRGLPPPQGLTEPECQQLQAMNVELDRRLADLMATWIEVNRPLRLRDKVLLEALFDRVQHQENLSRLAGGIAHDLNNVFGPILAVAQFLQLTQSDLDAEMREQLQLSEASARRGGRLVEQMVRLF